MSYSVGATLRYGVKAFKDADVVVNLKNAGAIPLAVTNTPELCCSIETFNGVTGYTKNPYNFARTCGGSSGGEVGPYVCTCTDGMCTSDGYTYTFVYLNFGTN